MTELVFRDDSYARSCVARVLASDARGIRLNRTVFYPTGGGQPGDTGALTLADGSTVKVIDAIKGDGVVHWEACVVPYARCVEVTGSHIGLACNRKSFQAVAEALAP